MGVRIEKIVNKICRGRPKETNYRLTDWACSGQFKSPKRKTKTNGIHDWFALTTIEFVSGSEKVDVFVLERESEFVV